MATAQLWVAAFCLVGLEKRTSKKKSNKILVNVIKGVDVCQIPKCDCSGRVNIQDPNLEFTANMLLLLENSVGDNLLSFTVIAFTQNGGTHTISAFQPLADEDFTISFCNSCH